MIVIRQSRILREDIRQNRRVLYLFGDNLQRIGSGGQAKEMRGEPNSFGIATKRRVSHGSPEDYLFDGQPDVMPIIEEEFTRLRHHIRSHLYSAIIVPSDGIGTGLARLTENAPKALAFINHNLSLL